MAVDAWHCNLGNIVVTIKKKLPTLMNLMYKCIWIEIEICCCCCCCPHHCWFICLFFFFHLLEIKINFRIYISESLAEPDPTLKCPFYGAGAYSGLL